MISGSKMKRINLEFSANLARLIRMLYLAYHHFAMPKRQKKRPSRSKIARPISFHSF
jgi:hypothetical protein